MRKTLAATLLAVTLSCSTKDDGGAPDAGKPAWRPVLTKLDGALLGVWGSGGTVLAVGGPGGNGFESLVVRFDGARWTRLHPGGSSTYWWVHGTSTDDAWFVGESGRITHYDGQSFKEHTSSTQATLFGVWAASPADVWAVGGTPEGGTAKENDVVLHFDGQAWRKEVLPGAPLGRALFKVWGASASDVYVVGEAGTVWHRREGAWTLESNPPLARGTLVTVHGCGPSDVYAVGSRDVLHSDGKAWTRVDVPVTNDVNGVSCSEGVALVGFGGLKLRFVGGQWIDDFTAEPHSDLHGAFTDASGVVWAVGGNFVAKPAAGVRRDGIVARFGPGSVATALEP